MNRRCFIPMAFFGLTRFVLHYNISVFFLFCYRRTKCLFCYRRTKCLFCYRRTKYLFVIGGQCLLSHTAEMLFQHLLDNAVSVFEELPDLGVGRLGEVNPAVIPEEPFETDRHGICQFCSIEIQLLVH